jgi:acyl carrier protein/D-alanine--poly(phosphoribitol) ligase subunit 2
LEQKIIAFIKNKIVDDPDIEITPDTELISSGLIDSFSLVTLYVYIEKEFGVKIPASRIIPDTFDTVEKIIVLINQYL